MYYFSVYSFFSLCRWNVLTCGRTTIRYIFSVDFRAGSFGNGKQLWEAGSLDWSDRFFSNCFWYVSYIVIYICHCFIRLKKIRFWNDTWKSVKCRFKKSLRKAILLNPAEVAVDIAYIDSLWVKESKYNSNAMPIPATSGSTEPLSFISYRTRSWTM